MKRTTIKNILIFVIVILVVLVVAKANNLLSEGDNTADYDGKAVDVDFYVMSQCPYGVQVENGFAPVLDKFGEAIDFDLDFIANEQGSGFSSLHGQPEVDGNIVQLCAMKYNPNRFMDMVICMNEDMGAIPNNWESCADGLDTEKIEQCYRGEEGKELLRESLMKAITAKASGSPTMYIEGQLYQGGRDELAFTREICKYLEDHPECKDMPECTQSTDCAAKEGMNAVCSNGECKYEEAQPVKMIVLNDKTCTSCDTRQILQTTRQLFKGLNIENVDVSSEQGKQLIEQLDVNLAPSYIFEANITNTAAWTSNPNLRGAFEKKGDYYMIRAASSGASHIIDEQARQEFYDSLGIETGDNRPQVDFFVMSYCPYGNQAEEAIYPVFAELKDDADFRPLYVIYENYGNECVDDGLVCSMHGAQELHQNMREKCVYEDEGIDEWFEFAMAMNDACSSANADSCWTSVAQELGLDVEKISTCESERGLDLMREDKEIQNMLGVSGSPTIFIEGNKHAGGRDSNSLLAAVCSRYEDAPAGCDVQLDTSGQAAPSSGSC